MKKFKDKIFIMLLFVILICAQFSLSDFFAKQNNEILAQCVEEEVTYGGMQDEIPVGASSISDYSNYYNSSMGTLPSKYCLRDDYCLFTQNQSYMGLCWDFSSGTALNTASMIGSKKYYNFSESYISLARAKSTSGSYYVGNGGTFDSFNSVASLYGIVLEQDYSYPDCFFACKEDINNQYNFYQTYADKSFMNDYKAVGYKKDIYETDSVKELQYRNSAKYHIKNYGSLFLDVKCFNTQTITISDKTVSIKIPNVNVNSGHALSAIGWDDNFHISKYPQYTGAWIILNSWGNTDCNEGICYIFYDDEDLKFNSNLYGYIYSPDETGLYYYDTIQSSNANLKIESGKYYLSGEKQTVTSQQGNIFYKNNVDITYNYSISSDAKVDSAKVYYKNVDVSNLFDININKLLKTINYASKSDIPIGNYKIVVKYSNNNESGEYYNELFVCNGYEIERLEVYANNGSSFTNGEYMAYNIYGDINPELNIYVKNSTGTFTLRCYYMSYGKTPQKFNVSGYQDQNINYLSSQYSYDLSEKDTYNVTITFTDGSTKQFSIKLNLVDSNNYISQARYKDDYGVINTNPSKIILSQTQNWTLEDAEKNGCLFKGWYKDLTKLTKENDKYVLQYENLSIHRNPTIGNCAKEIYNTVKYDYICNSFLYSEFGNTEKKTLTIKYLNEKGDDYVTTSVTAYVGNDLNNYIPERTGYDFAGWFKDMACTIPYDSEVMPNEDLTLYAKYSIKQITVNANQGANGSIMPRGKYTGNYGISITFKFKPNTHYHVSKILLDSEEVEITEDILTNGLTIVFTEDHNLKVEFEIDKFKINYYSEGDLFSSNEYDYGATEFNLPSENPTKTGYEFAGWYDDQNFENEFEFPSSMPDCDISVYAKFNICQYKLNYNYGCDDAELEDVYDKFEEFDYGAEVDLTSFKPERTGYDFAGWYRESSLTNEITTPFEMPADEITVYANWEPKTYSVFAYPNYDSKEPTELLFEYTQDIILDDLERTGYDFAGWFATKDCEDGEEFTLEKMPANNVDVYAKWTKKSYAIKFIDGEDEIESNNVLFEENIEYPQNLTQKGHTFAGWYESSNFDETSLFEDEKMPARDVILYAKWNINNYSIYYHYNYVDKPEPEPYKEEWQYDEDVTLWNIPNEDTEKIKYNFVGWYSSSECNGEQFSISKMPDDKIDVFAKWEIKTYTITFNIGDNGSISPSDLTTLKHDQSYTYKVRPNAHYHLTKLMIDDEVLNIENQYVQDDTDGDYYKVYISSITKDMTITAEFEIDTFVVNIEIGELGTINIESGISYTYGENVEIEITPNAGCDITKILINEEEYSLTDFNGKLNIIVDKDFTVKIEIEKRAFTVTLHIEGNGTVSPNESKLYKYETSATYLINPNTGYELHAIKIGEDNGIQNFNSANNTFTIPSIKFDCDVYITFTKIMSLIKIFGESNNIVTCDEDITKIEYGDSRVLNFNFDDKEKILVVTVDGIKQIVENNSLEIKNIKKDVIVIVELETYPFYMTKLGQIIIISVIGGIVILSVMSSLRKRKKHSKMSKKSNGPLQQVNTYAERKEEQIVEPRRIRKDVFSTSDMFGNIAKKQTTQVGTSTEVNKKVENVNKPKIPPKRPH